MKRKIRIPCINDFYILAMFLHQFAKLQCNAKIHIFSIA